MHMPRLYREHVCIWAKANTSGPGQGSRDEASCLNYRHCQLLLVIPEFCSHPQTKLIFHQSKSPCTFCSVGAACQSSAGTGFVAAQGSELPVCGSWWSHVKWAGFFGFFFFFFFWSPNCSCRQNPSPAEPSLTGGYTGGVPGNHRRFQTKQF